MIAAFTYDRDKRELLQLTGLLKEEAALQTDERWSFNHAISLEEVKEFFAKDPLLDVMLYDVTDKGALEYLHNLRKDYRTLQLLIIADVQTSPMEYMKPGILASSLILRPLDKQKAKAVLEELIKDMMQSIRREGERLNYVIESKDGILKIPYQRISFFEAREKKVFLCAGREEYGFRHTIEELQQELPSHFVRCHRGYIVNCRKIRRVDVTQNVVCLEDGFTVPYSRSYKTILKESVKDAENG